MANQEACELFVQQEIDEGLKAGKTPHTIENELSSWLEENLKAKIEPGTIKKRAQRRKDKLQKGTNVPPKAKLEKSQDAHWRAVEKKLVSLREYISENCNIPAEMQPETAVTLWAGWLDLKEEMVSIKNGLPVKIEQ